MARFAKVMLVVAIVTLLAILLDLYPKIILPVWDAIVQPKDGEMESIREILAVEIEMLNICKNRLIEYHDEIQRLGIEIRVEIRQKRGLYGARVESYDLYEKHRLPRRYSSEIDCFAYKDGELLSKKAEYDKRVTQLYGVFFRVVQNWNPNTNEKEIWFFEDPFSAFDTELTRLLAEIERDFG